MRIASRFQGWKKNCQKIIQIFRKIVSKFGDFSRFFKFLGFIKSLSFEMAVKSKPFIGWRYFFKILMRIVSWFQWWNFFCRLIIQIFRKVASKFSVFQIFRFYEGWSFEMAVKSKPLTGNWWNFGFWQIFSHWFWEWNFFWDF